MSICLHPRRTTAARARTVCPSIRRGHSSPSDLGPWTVVPLPRALGGRRSRPADLRGGGFHGALAIGLKEGQQQRPLTDAAAESWPGGSASLAKAPKMRLVRTVLVSCDLIGSLGLGRIDESACSMRLHAAAVAPRFDQESDGPFDRYHWGSESIISSRETPRPPSSSVIVLGHPGVVLVVAVVVAAVAPASFGARRVRSSPVLVQESWSRTLSVARRLVPGLRFCGFPSRAHMRWLSVSLVSSGSLWLSSPKRYPPRFTRHPPPLLARVD